MEINKVYDIEKIVEMLALNEILELEDENGNRIAFVSSWPDIIKYDLKGKKVKILEQEEVNVYDQKVIYSYRARIVKGRLED